MNDLAEQQAKRALRQEFLQRRRQLAAAEAAAASAEICRRLSACLAERLPPAGRSLPSGTPPSRRRRQTPTRG